MANIKVDYRGYNVMYRDEVLGHTAVQWVKATNEEQAVALAKSYIPARRFTILRADKALQYCNNGYAGFYGDMK